MSVVSITFHTALAVAQQIAAERRDHVDTSKSFKEGGCIVGELLHRLGVNTVRPGIAGNPACSCCNYRNHVEMENAGLIFFEHPTRMFFSQLISRNDSGQTWDQCVKGATETMRRAYPALFVDIKAVPDPEPEKETIPEEESKDLFDQITSTPVVTASESKELVATG